jgi:hypothetical protein
VEGRRCWLDRSCCLRCFCRFDLICQFLKNLVAGTEDSGLAILEHKHQIGNLQ